MMKSIKKYLFDIKTAIQSIEEFVEPVNSVEEYQKNKLIRRAVSRNPTGPGKAPGILGVITKYLPRLKDEVDKLLSDEEGYERGRERCSAWFLPRVHRFCL